ncbi:MAG TPA: LytTR family DNA-binding domain-containing protein [Chitinophagaceae bacterium]|nr:LytTR family DNA-binding domain-containing protein [Chitinophagaceae bacterium]
MDEFLFFKAGKKHFKIDTNAILYVHAEKRYVTFVTEGKCYPAQISISCVEKLLSPKLFCRVHRSYIISLKHTDAFDNELAYIGKKKIPIAEQYKNTLKALIHVINSNKSPIKLGNDDVDKLLNDLNSEN